MALYPDGGLAEFIRVPEWLLDRMPEGIQPAVAAKVHDLANAWRALKLTGARPGATVIVTAATGAMGASIAILAPVAGIGRLVLVGRDRARLDAVGRLAGIPVAHVALGELGAWQDEDGLTRALLDRVPDGADAAIDFLPEGPGLSQAILALRPGGVAVTMAPNRQPPRVAIAALMSRCVTLIGSRNCTRSDARQVVALLDQGLADASPLITHRVPLTDVNRALEIVRDRREQPTWMCVVEPQPQEVIT